MHNWSNHCEIRRRQWCVVTNDSDVVNLPHVVPNSIRICEHRRPNRRSLLNREHAEEKCWLSSSVFADCVFNKSSFALCIFHFNCSFFLLLLLPHDSKKAIIRCFAEFLFCFAVLGWSTMGRGTLVARQKATLCLQLWPETTESFSGPPAAASISAASLGRCQCCI